MMRDALCLVYKQVLDASPSVFLATHNNIGVFVSPRDVVVGGVVTWLLSQWWPVGFLTLPFHQEQWMTRGRSVHKWYLFWRGIQRGFWMHRQSWLSSAAVGSSPGHRVSRSGNNLIEARTVTCT